MKMYQIDSFTDEIFAGNPAAVCLLEDGWLQEETMQKIAAENNLSETAFVCLKDMYIRWFTPVAEVGLCGHATLAAAHALFFHEGISQQELVLNSKTGKLKVSKDEQDKNLLCLDFPKDTIKQITFEDKLDCFNFKPKEVWQGREEYVLVFETEEEVKNAVCNLEKAKNIDLSGFIITAWSGRKENNEDIDYVLRYFSPKYGIDEDPVTGSAQTLLVPYWQQKTNKTTFNVRQISARGGKLMCRDAGERVLIAGKAVTFFEGKVVTC